jgi:hypothetical protein
VRDSSSCGAALPSTTRTPRTHARTHARTHSHALPPLPYSTQVVQLVARARTAASVAQRMERELSRDVDGSSVQRLEVLYEDDHIGACVCTLCPPLCHHRPSAMPMIVVATTTPSNAGVVLKPPGMTCQGRGTTTVQGLLPYSLRPVVVLARATEADARE